MSDQYDVRSETEKHILDPQPGDYFADHCCPVALIEKRDDDFVRLRKAVVENNERFWNEPEYMTLNAFKKWLAYGTIPGYWVEYVGVRPLVSATPAQEDK